MRSFWQIVSRGYELVTHQCIMPALHATANHLQGTTPILDKTSPLVLDSNLFVTLSCSKCANGKVRLDLHASQPITMNLYVAYCLGPICNLPSWFQASYQICLRACQWVELILKWQSSMLPRLSSPSIATLLSLGKPGQTLIQQYNYYFLLIRIQKLNNLARTAMLQHAKCGHSHHNKQGQKCTAAKHGLHRFLHHKGRLSGHSCVNRLVGSARVNNHSKYSIIRYILI